VTTPAPLGRGLGRSLAFATVLGMLVFGITMVAVIYFTELGETCSYIGELEDPPGEIVTQCAIALAFALPLGIGLSLLVGRPLTPQTTQPLDLLHTRKVGRDGNALSEARQFPSERVARLRVPRRDVDLDAVLDIGPSDHFADAPTSAGDERRAPARQATAYDHARLAVVR